eukprot:scaffold65850_cov45-Prasinocladus_malaysianus.AAC.1
MACPLAAVLLLCSSASRGLNVSWCWPLAAYAKICVAVTGKEIPSPLNWVQATGCACIIARWKILFISN